MEDFKNIESLWTTRKDDYYIEISNGEFYIMSNDKVSSDKMLLLVEDRDEYINIVRTMIQNNVKILKIDNQTGSNIIVSSKEALLEFDSVPRKKVKVKIIWEEGGSIKIQLLKLKKIYDQFSQISITHLYKQINNQEKVWVFAEMDYKAANELLA